MAEPLRFFDDFRELSERSSYRLKAFDGKFVELSNPVCGDVVRVQVQLVGQKVGSFGYQQRGCWPVTGCLELLGGLVIGWTVEQVLAFRLHDFLALVPDHPASKRHAFSLTHKALLQAVSQGLSGQAESNEEPPDESAGNDSGNRQSGIGAADLKKGYTKK